jgi:hypothetical protein
MSAVLLLVVHELLCAVLLYSCFCRATRTNSDTALPILVSFWLLSVSALFATLAPIMIDWQPDAVSLLLLASVTLVQTVTARYWQQSPPFAFQRPGYDQDDFVDSDHWTNRTDPGSRCPTTQPTDWGKP